MLQCTLSEIKVFDICEKDSGYYEEILQKNDQEKQNKKHKILYLLECFYFYSCAAKAHLFRIFFWIFFFS